MSPLSARARRWSSVFALATAVLSFAAVFVLQKAGMLNEDDVSRIWASEDMRNIQELQRQHFDSTGRYAATIPGALLDQRTEPRTFDFRGDSAGYAARSAYFDGAVGCSVFGGESAPIPPASLPDFVTCDAPRPSLRGGRLAVLLLGLGAASVAAAAWLRRAPNV